MGAHPYFWKHPYVFCILSFFFLDNPPIHWFSKKNYPQNEDVMKLDPPKQNLPEVSACIKQNKKINQTTHLTEYSGKQLAVSVFDIWNQHLLLFRGNPADPLDNQGAWTNPSSVDTWAGPVAQLGFFPSISVVTYCAYGPEKNPNNQFKMDGNGHFKSFPTVDDWNPDPPGMYKPCK